MAQVSFLVSHIEQMLWTSFNVMSLKHFLWPKHVFSPYHDVEKPAFL